MKWERKETNHVLHDKLCIFLFDSTRGGGGWFLVRRKYSTYAYTHVGRVPLHHHSFSSGSIIFSTFMLGCFSLSPFLLLISSSSSSSSLPSPCLETRLGNKATRPFFFFFLSQRYPPLVRKQNEFRRWTMSRADKLWGTFSAAASSNAPGASARRRHLGCCLSSRSVGAGARRRRQARSIGRGFSSSKKHTHTTSQQKDKKFVDGVFGFCCCWRRKGAGGLVGKTKRKRFGRRCGRCGLRVCGWVVCRRCVLVDGEGMDGIYA